MRTNEFDTSNVLSEKAGYMGKCFTQCFDGFHDGIVNIYSWRNIFHAVWGEMPLPIDVSWLSNELLEISKRIYIDDLLNKVKVMQKLAKKNVTETQQKNEADMIKLQKCQNFNHETRSHWKL